VNSSNGDIEMEDISISTMNARVVDEVELNDYYMHEFFASETREEDHEPEDEPEDVLEREKDRYKKQIIIVSRCFMKFECFLP
jgi:hypothetical protein